MHAMHDNSTLASVAEYSTVDIDLTLNKSVSNLLDEVKMAPKDLQDIQESLLHKFLSNPLQTILDEILESISSIERESELLGVLSSPAAFDKEPS